MTAAVSAAASAGAPLRFGPNRKLLIVRSIGALVFALFPAAAVTIPLMITGQRPATIVAAAVATFVAIAGLRILYLHAHFPTIRYELTDVELTTAEGLYWETRRTTPLEKVTNVDVNQGPLDRYLGIGSVGVFTPSTGALTPESMLVGVDDPHAVRARILAQAEAARSAPAGRAPGAATPSSAGAQTLEEILHTLQRIEGLLTARAQ